MQPITSPFALSPVAAISQSNYSKMMLPENGHNHGRSQNDLHKQQPSGEHFTHDHNSVDSTVECKPPPPTEGFLPRESGIRFRDDIRSVQKVHSCPVHISQSQSLLSTLCNNEQNTSHPSNSKFYDNIPNGTTVTCGLNSSPSSHLLCSLISSDSCMPKSRSVFKQERNCQDSSVQTCELNFDSLRSEAKLIPF